MDKYKELLDQETKRLEAKDVMAQKTIETRVGVVTDFLTKLNPFLEYLNENYVHSLNNGSGSMNQRNLFPCEFVSYKPKTDLHAKFNLENFLAEKGDMRYGVTLKILGDELKIKCDSNFKLNMVWGYERNEETNNAFPRVIECVSDIEAVAMKTVAKLLRRENTFHNSYPSSHFTFDAK